MAIGIVGNYGNNNQGDEAILEGILIQLKKVHQIERQDIIVFSNQPERTSEKYGVKSVKLYYKKNNAPLTLFRTLKKNSSIIRDLDLLIIGGGGIFMDLYGREAFIFGMYGWLAKLSRTPVVLYGVGAGPILTRIGKVILRSLAHLSKVITVRDPKSKELLESIGVKSSIHVIGDPAFQVNPPEREGSKQDDAINIGVTAVPFHHISYWPKEDKVKYRAYIEGMAQNLDHLVDYYPNARINFFSTKHPQDTMVTKEIRELMTHKDQCSIADRPMDHQEITDFASKQDLVIGTRLHSLILALVSATPVIAVSYHHKVEDFMGMIGCEEYTIPIDQLDSTPMYFLDSCRAMFAEWDGTLQRFAGISGRMRGEALKGMDLVKRSLENDEQDQLLVLSNMYPSEHSRTFGLFVKNQVELLRDRGLAVDVVAIDDPRKGKIQLLKKYTSFFFGSLGKLVTRGSSYQAVHAHYIFPTGLAGLLFKKLLGRKLIVTSHGGDIDQMSKKSSIVQKLTGKILHEADHIIAVGEGLKQDIHENFSISDDKISVINMGVNRNVFHEHSKEEIRKKLGVDQEEKMLLFVGNLIRAKGLDELTAAYRTLTKEDPSITLHLIGEPKDEAYFQELSEKTDALEGGTIHGGMAQTDVAEWMAASDVFVLPSHIEGFGLVALEAMACGLPVVGTDVGGLSYLLAEGAGVKTEAKNPEALTKGIRKVLTDPSLKETLIANGRKKADEYDQDRLITSVLALYES
ncbi:polysaccharide pyruvyl transferase family protein [Virgibacillus sediminis]|uniref:Polysaccharide pyruvyl transferase family protein n=1 Tax=Virgibacillus sediminis TaxID=202260 RepID=A0ABV7A4J0_9BACI